MKGIFFRDFATDHIGEIARECYCDRIYDPFLRSGMVIVEAGANVGMVTLYLAQYAKYLLAVEPCGAHHDVLCQMVAFNNLENVGIARVALAAKNEDRFLALDTGNSTMHRLSATPTDHRVRAMSTTSLLDGYKINKVDFLKLDVEGAEFEILQSDSFKKEAPRIKTMVVECHRDPRDLEKLLTEAGYEWRQLRVPGWIYGCKRREA